MRVLATSLGVPEEAIRTEKRVRRTYDYILRVRETALTEGWDSLILITSEEHRRRADLTFVRNAPDLKVIHAPQPGPGRKRGRWYWTLRQVRQILHEYLGIAYYQLKGWI
jgi:uncharacterized SAM-binding protein YcdF (DUF218 family)